MRLGGRWSPILIHEASGVVIDGVHRLAAARLLGMARIEASLFSGGPDEALIEFVRRNVHHGLPLTLRERKCAAGRVLGVHPQWSDRRVAGICALSPKTVGRLRVVSSDGRSEEIPQLDNRVRMGRDNRLRPVDNASVRERVAAAIRAQPEASLRCVAAEVGVSPETVRSVRLSLSRAIATELPPTEHLADDAVIEETAEVGPPVAVGSAGRGLAVVPDAPDLYAEFVKWFNITEVSSEESLKWAEVVPVSRVEEAVAEANRRSQVWLNFARQLSAGASHAT
jgi:hypothetical protein